MRVTILPSLFWPVPSLPIPHTYRSEQISAIVPPRRSPIDMPFTHHHPRLSSGISAAAPRVSPSWSGTRIPDQSFSAKSGQHHRYSTTCHDRNERHTRCLGMIVHNDEDIASKRAKPVVPREVIVDRAGFCVIHIKVLSILDPLAYVPVDLLGYPRIVSWILALWQQSVKARAVVLLVPRVSW